MAAKVKKTDDYEPVSVSALEYWATYPIGGSGMSVSIQRQLKSMANEILISRGLGSYEGKVWIRGGD